jgi:hypothetical protein
MVTSQATVFLSKLRAFISEKVIIALIGLALFRRCVGARRGIDFRASKHKML